METVEHGRQYRERGNERKQTRREEAGKTQGHWTLSRSSLDDAATCTPPASGWCRAGPRRAPPLRQQKNGPVARPPTAGRAVWAGTRDANGEGPQKEHERGRRSEKGASEEGVRDGGGKHLMVEARFPRRAQYLQTRTNTSRRGRGAATAASAAGAAAPEAGGEGHGGVRRRGGRGTQRMTGAPRPSAQGQAARSLYSAGRLGPLPRTARARKALPTQGAGGREARHSRAHGPALLLPLSLPQLLDTRRA